VTKGCWIHHKINKNGYGVVSFEGKTHLMHRLVYTLLVGNIPTRFHVHHNCENKACCNPNHLEALSAPKHYAKGNHSKIFRPKPPKTHCIRGHKFTDENSFIYKPKTGKAVRACKECRRILARKLKIAQQKAYHSLK